MSYFNTENYTYMPYYPTSNKMDYYQDAIYHHTPPHGKFLVIFQVIIFGNNSFTLFFLF
jgi:hypothetical protein